MTLITSNYLGIAFLIICSILYWKAFKCNVHSPHALLLLIVAGFLLRLYVGLDPELHPWDERFHALVAKHLMQHWLKPTLYEQPALAYDYRNWTSNHIWLHKQPLALWLIACSLKLFGLHAWAVRVPSIVLSTLGIKLTYDIGAELYDRPTAFISAFLFSIQGFIIEVAGGRTSTDHVDSIFLFFVLLAVWVSVKGSKKLSYSHTIFTGLSLGAALLTKWMPALIVLPVWMILNYKKQSLKNHMLHLAIIIVLGVIVALPWQIHILTQFPKEATFEYQYNTKHLFYPLEGHSGGLGYHFDRLRIMYGELVYLPILLFLIRAARYRKKADIAASVWFLLVFLFFSFAATKMPGYTLIAAPAILIMTAVFFHEMIRRPHFLPKICALLFIALPIRYSIERIKPFQRYSFCEATYQTNLSPNSAIYDSQHYAEVMFYTDHTSHKPLLSKTASQR